MTTKFTVNKMRILSWWEYDLPSNTECSICRESVNTNSLYHQEKGLDSYVVKGTCSHSFHYECINPWVDKNKTCALCVKPWVYESKPPEKLKG